MMKNILAIVLTVLCFSSVHQAHAQHGLEKIQKHYKKFLGHVVIDVLQQIKDEQDIHKRFFVEIHRDLLAWKIFWRITVKDFCKTQKLNKLTENEYFKKLCSDKSKFWLSKDLIDLGYVDDKETLHPLALEAFSSIALVLRKLIVLTSGYFLPPEERKKRGLTGNHFDVNLEICINAFDEVYSSMFEMILDYMLKDDFEEKSSAQIIKDFSEEFNDQ